MSEMHTYIHVCVCVCVCMCVCTCMFLRTCVYDIVYMYVRLLCAHMDVHACVQYI